MEVIIPCAGASSRFPGVRPKYLLTDYSAKLMIEKAAEHYIGKHNVTIVILKDHEIKYGVSSELKEKFGNKINLVILDNPTLGPADTVYQAIKKGNINLQEQLLVKDCDGFYKTTEIEGNAIYIAKLSKHPNIKTAGAKSYTVSNNQNIINCVVEKSIVSNHFCVGGYQFKTAQSFLDAFDNLKDNLTKEIFVSNIIDYLISSGTVFFESEVEDFIDVGTIEDWYEYNNKPTYFCDIDGTILVSKEGYNNGYEALENNVKVLLNKKSEGCKIIFCTARPEKYRQVTRSMLDELGFVDCDLIMGIHHSKRIIINDYAKTNPYPTAIAINLKRDADNLGEMI
jgi:hypothetical protein